MCEGSVSPGCGATTVCEAAQAGSTTKEVLSACPWAVWTYQSHYETERHQHPTEFSSGQGVIRECVHLKMVPWML